MAISRKVEEEEKEKLADDQIKLLSKLIETVKFLESNEAAAAKNLKSISESVDAAKQLLLTAMTEATVIDFTTKKGIRATIKTNARGAIKDWKVFWKLLSDRKELQIVEMKFSGNLRSAIEEYVEEHKKELGADDIILSAHWGRLQSWLKEVASEENVELTELKLPGLEINSWEEVKVK